MSVVIRLLCLVLFASTLLEALAQPPDEEDLALSYGGEEFVSIATGRRQPISRAPAVATVITAADIDEMGATNLDQVLESVPGLHVSLSSLRLSPIYVIRGIHTDRNPQVLMLVNGVPITQLFLGDRGARFTLPVASIARVEVIRGPGSAVYGAEAFAGVINVTTKNAADIDGTLLGGRVGSFDTQEGWLLYGKKWGGFDVAFSVEGLHTDRDDDRIIDVDAQTMFDSILGTNASLAPRPLDTRQKRLDARLELGYSNWRLRLWNWRQFDTGVGAGLALALDPTGRIDIDNYLADLTYHNPDFTRHWDLMGRFSYMDINSTSEQKLFPPGTVLPIGRDGNINPDPTSSSPVLFPDGFIGNPEIFERHLRLDLSGSYSGIENHRPRLAAGFYYADLDPKETKNFGPGVIDGMVSPINGTLTDVTGTEFVFTKSENRRVYYASIQDEWAFAPDWSLTAGMRFDDYSDFGSTINPRLALVWETRHDLTTKVLYGRAFRAPSFAELFAVNNPVLLGNPDLQPEIINTVELAFDYHPTFDLGTTLNLFAYDIDDLIELVPDPSGTSSTARNTKGQEGYGFELGFDWNVTGQVWLGGNYAFQHSENKATNRVAGNAPQGQIYLNPKWHFKPDWLLSTELNWVGDRERAATDPRDSISDYTTVDVTLRRKKVAGHWDLAIGVRNLFDEDAREPSPATPGVPAGSFIPDDFPLPGRAAYVEAQVRF